MELQQMSLTEYGQFMEFEFLTRVPIELEAIDKSIMTENDVKLLNDYHKDVYEALSPYFTGEEALWLTENTRAI
jgi:Xaa-Pro aminopeptidase